MARLVQLTDLHLTARGDGRVFGSDVWANLDRALAHVATLGDVARLVLTGDLANSGAAAVYARLAERLAPWRDRLRIVPGNHDHRERLRAAFPELWPTDAPRLVVADDVGGVRWFGLDSLCDGRTRGRLDPWQIGWLRGQLAAWPGPYALFLHHPPLRVGTWWLDKDLLRDRDALGDCLAPRPPLAIFTGHVHQLAEGVFAGAPVHTTPAVAYQYGVRAWLPLPVARTPALRILEVTAGQLASEVRRLS